MDADGTVYIYYASSDTRTHVAVSSVTKLLDYCLNTPADGLRSAESLRKVINLIDHNMHYINNKSRGGVGHLSQ
ncbi:hypothetical protein [Sphingobacterium sp. E70]|nr:hypothetical protein [Sphingobacterium sp. E70]